MDLLKIIKKRLSDKLLLYDTETLRGTFIGVDVESLLKLDYDEHILKGF